MSYEKRFLEAYDKYGAQIMRHISFRVSNERFAQDIFQETFLKTWRAIANGQDIDNIKAFLYTVARNLIIDHYRGKERTDIPIEDLGEKEPASNDLMDKTSNRLEAEKIKKAIRELDNEEEREIIYMRYVDDFSAQEIAKITGKTDNNVRVICHRALKKLREKLYA